MNRLLTIAVKSVAANLLPEDLFDPGLDLASVRRLFATYVRVVEIENHSYCNRTCSFCPNAQIDRRSVNHLLTGSVYEKILSDLSSIDYAQSLIWSRYHEPLAHDSIVERIAQARRAMPKAHLVLVSNGDYLNREFLRRLEQAGADRIMLDLYLPEGRERDAVVIDRELKKFTDRTGLHLSPNGNYEFRCGGSRIDITMGVPLYTAANMSTRGGLVQVTELMAHQRTAVCFNPLHSVVIDYNGKGMLCCQVRSDAPQHAESVIGNLSDPAYGIFHLYRDLAPARRGLLTPGPKLGVCRTCTVSAVGPDRLARRQSVASLASRVPGVQAGLRLAVRFASRQRKYEIG